MKTYIPILLILLLGCKSITPTADNTSKETTSVPKYQKLKTFKGTTNDTLAYVRTSIIDRKSEYIGKDLNALLDDLELPIKAFSRGHSNLRNISPDISLKFYPKNVLDSKKYNKIDPVILVIVWENPLPLSQIEPLFLKNKGNWTTEEQEYFGKQKVKDIGLVDYKFQ